MAKNILLKHQLWLKTLGKKGQDHDKNNTFRAVFVRPTKSIYSWDISKFKNRWDLIEKKLKD